MQRFFLYANPGKPETIKAVSYFADLLINKGCDVLLDGWLFDLMHKGHRMSPDQLDESVQAVVCFGGDGTILRILPYLAARRIPVLGVNMGHTGFLLQVNPEELDVVLDRFIAKDYVIKERAMLACEINGQATYLVMNEFALTRGQNPCSIVVEVQYEGERVFTTHGDGVLVSTPTGTTGYCLSAGGPVIFPGVACHIVVPVCSHIMHQRPIILPQEGEIHLQVHENHGARHQISMDGQIVLDLDTKSDVRITQAKETAQFIHFSPEQFLTRLDFKQRKWSNHVYGGKQ